MVYRSYLFIFKTRVAIELPLVKKKEMSRDSSTKVILMFLICYFYFRL